MEACMVRSPRSRSKSPLRQRPRSPESLRRTEAFQQYRQAHWQDEDEDDEGWLWDSGLMRWLRKNRLGGCLCLLTVVLLRLLVLLLIVWLVGFLHVGLGVPCFVLLFSLWVHGERQHAAFSSYLTQLCEMAHGRMTQ